MLELLIKEVYNKQVTIEKAERILRFYVYTTDMNVREYQDKIQIYKEKKNGRI